MSVKTLVRFSSTRPKAVGECDRCGHIYRRIDLSPQMRFAGASIIDTGLRVCSECLDPLDPQEKLTIPLPDGLPIHDPRPINYTVAAKYNWTIRPQPGWLNWSSVGAPTTSNVMTPVTTGVGSMTWTGHAPTAVQVTVANTGLAALSWSGHTPTISYRVATGVASATWSGHAPTPTYAVLPGVGVVTWSGHAPAYTKEQDAQLGFAPFGELAFGQGGRAV